ncbi:hypothetical protein BVX98_00650, partial [bacterium F11]
MRKMGLGHWMAVIGFGFLTLIYAQINLPASDPQVGSQGGVVPPPTTGLPALSHPIGHFVLENADEPEVVGINKPEVSFIGTREDDVVNEAPTLRLEYSSNEMQGQLSPSSRRGGIMAQG